MAGGDFELYVSHEKFTSELQALDARLGSLTTLLGEYQAKKDEARRVWGEEDENLAKAQHMCDSAIQVVQRKIDETKASKEALQSILENATQIQGDIGGKLDEAQSQINSLLG